MKNQKKKYYKPVRVSSFWSNSHIEHESKVIQVKHYQLKNILIKLDHI